MMLLLFGMAGIQLDYLIIALVGSSFLLRILFSCPRGGFPLIQHNEIRDLTASLLAEVCTEVQVEPTLQPKTGEHFDHGTLNTEDGACLDVSMNG